MLRLLLLPILFLVSKAAMAQGFTPWNPFPHKQITMWQKPDGSHDLHYNDSMRVNGNVKEHFFGLEQYTRDIHACDTGLLRYYADASSFQAWGTNTVFQFYIDSLQSENDVVWRFSNPNRPFELRTHEPLNASWGFRFINGNVFDSISMTVTNVDTATFLEYFDSVKTIRMQPYRQGTAVGRFWEYKVSRSAGMVQYIPFHKILRNQVPEVWSIMGFEHASGGHYGFTSSFKDYFGGFSVGDKYKYYSTVYITPWGPGLGSTSIYIDSIMAVANNANGITLTVRSEGSHSSYTSSQSFGTTFYNYVTDVVYSKSVEDGFGLSRKDFVYFSDSLGSTGFMGFNSRLQVLDTLRRIGRTATCNNAGNSPPSCIRLCFECVMSRNYVKGLGLESANPSCDSHFYLMGYQKAGQAPVGDMSRISGLGEVSTNPLRLFPNPAKNAVYLEGVSDNAQVQVFDIHGKLLLSTTYTLGAAIPTTDLNDGVYLVRVNDGANLLVSKLMIAK